MGWLLDHPDIHVTELSDADTVSDEYSEEEVLEELEETEPTFPVVRLCTLDIIMIKVCGDSPKSTSSCRLFGLTLIKRCRLASSSLQVWW